MGWRDVKQRLAGVRVDPDPVPVILPASVREEVVRHLRDRDEVTAVRVVRQRTGLDLLSAVRAVRAIPDGQDADDD